MAKEHEDLHNPDGERYFTSEKYENRKKGTEEKTRQEGKMEYQKKKGTNPKPSKGAGKGKKY